MACTSAALKGLVADCETSMGGVKAVWLAPADTFKPTVSGDTITSGTTTGFKYFYFRKGAASMTSTLNVDAANGINYVSTELVMNFTKMDTTKRVEMSALALNDMEAIVEDSNGKYWFLGFDEPITATAGSGQTGQAKTDGNFYSITITDESNSWPYTIADSVVENLTTTNA